ncbi:hypothetical protein AYO46_07525 [Betaproteobacteria bacterium SCGC AG-212-J23]|nr:hypothetical protein AYO46_07525 [Betaproteobacteria bacterium SCGC AG-212-J23]
MNEETKLIGLPTLKAKLDIKGNSTVYEWIRERGFPKQVSNGGGRFARWVEAEVDAWILNRIRERDQLAKAA